MLKLIADLKDILSNTDRVMNIIKEEMNEIKQRFGDKRKTEIDMNSIEYIEDESLIPVEDIIITITNKGYVKRMTTDTYRTQNRGGVGVKGMSTNEEDFADILISLKTHDYVMLFTNKGKVYRLKGYEIPVFNRQSKGLPVINLLPLEKEEIVNSIVSISNDDNNKYLTFVTKKGLIKRTDLADFERIRNSGKIAITLKEDDELISVKKTSGDNYVLIGSNDGRMVKFIENQIRIMGRTASGVRGINLNSNCICIGAEVSNRGEEVLIVTEKGYGKRTNVDEFRETKRGSKGVKALNITEKNGSIVSFKIVDSDTEDVMIITDNGIIIRLPIKQISLLGRVTQGVRLINLKDNQKVSTIAKIKIEPEEEIQPNE